MNIGFDAKRAFHNTTGLGNYSRDLIRILSQFYSNNNYFLYNPKPKKVTRLQLKENMKEVLPTSFFWKKLSAIWRQKTIVKQLLSDKIDLFHGLSGEIPKDLKSKKIKSVVTIHDLIFVRYPNLYSFFDRKIYFNKFLHAAKNADRVIAISEQTKRDIVEFLKINPTKIDVVYQGCHAVFKSKLPKETIDKVLKKHQLPSSFILNVGTIEERKNLLTVVKSIKSIDIPLVVVGRKTSYFKRIQEYINEYQLQNKIYFLEGLTLQEIAALYQQSEMFVYPSIFEGFGIPIIEALYSKTPVITSKGGCFSEAGGPNSIYIDPTDEKELTQQINYLLENKDKQQQIIESGYNFAQKFNDEIVAREITKVYEKITGT